MIRDAEFWSEVAQYEPLQRPTKAAGHEICATPPQPETPSEPTHELLQTHFLAVLALHVSRIVEPRSSGASADSCASKASEAHEPFGTLSDDDGMTPTTAIKAAGTPVTQFTLRVVQHIMMFAQPLDSLRYTISAMSVCNAGSVVVDKKGRCHVMGSIPRPSNTSKLQQTRFVGCEATDEAVLLLASNGDLYCAGRLDHQICYNDGPPRSHALKSLAHGVKMILAKDGKLLCLTASNTVRTLYYHSAFHGQGGILPYRLVRWAALGERDASFMIGLDSILYKNSLAPQGITTPRKVQLMSQHPVSRVSAGNAFWCAIDMSGRVWSMGRNRDGQVGNGRKEQVCNVPYCHETLSSHFAVQVAAGHSHALVLTASGVVYGCGSNTSGQLGLGRHCEGKAKMTKIRVGGRCVGITAGTYSSIFALEDGSIAGCGLNDCGQLGDSAQHGAQFSVVVLYSSGGAASYVATRPLKTDSMPNTPTANSQHGNEPYGKKERTKCNCQCAIC